MIQTHKTQNQTFEKVQGKVYVTINNTKLQVKEKFSLSGIYNEVELFKRKTNG